MAGREWLRRFWSVAGIRSMMAEERSALMEPSLLNVKRKQQLLLLFRHVVLVAIGTC